METTKPSSIILKILLKDFSVKHTITFIAKEVGMTRVGAWKVLKKLEAEKLIFLSPFGTGKTSAYNISLNWDNPLVEKILSLALTEDAIKNQKWIDNFIELKNKVNFLIIYGSIIHFPKEANDIDLLGITNKNKFVDDKTAKEYLNKVKVNLQLCDLYKEQGFDYKIPGEWFYTLYYCALAILAKFGIESRSQKCTAFFLRYVKDNNLIEYDDDFIDRIIVYRSKEEKSDVDEREKARYSSSIKSKEIESKYEYMTNICKKAIFQCEEIVFSNKIFEVPKELYK